MLKVYGLPNCDTCRKAVKWLASQDVEFQFHNVREDGLRAKDLSAWIKQHGLDVVVNKRSTTWRDLDESIKSSLDEKNAPALLVDNPTLLKRPLFDFGKGDVIIGFKAAEQAAITERLP